MSLVGVNWKSRAIALLHGNKSMTGCLLIAVLGRKVNPPCIAPANIETGYPRILKDGRVQFLYKATLQSEWAFDYEPVIEMRDRFRHLADALDLSDSDRIAMFDELKRFLVKDERVISKLEG